MEKHGADGELEEILEIPIEGVLDLHTFNPREVKGLLTDYLSACRQQGIYEVRIVHGKGSGTLRKTVHSILNKLPGVASFMLASGDRGGWGATIVILKRTQM